MTPSLPFTPKVPPLAHQLRELDLHGRARTWGHWWEVGTCKTKQALDEFALLEAERAVGAMLVVAPNGVHLNWARNQIPEHLADDLSARCKVFAWQSSKAGTNKHAAAAGELLKHRGPRVLVASYDSLMTDRGAGFVRKFLESQPCLYVLDESHRAKNPNAATTKRVLASAKYAPYRRAMTGTPIAQRPFDAYSQVRFLNPDAWHRFGISGYPAFRAYFGVYAPSYGVGGREFLKLVDHRNIEQMQQVVLEHGTRIRKADVLDLPPMTYEKRYFALSAEQQRAYSQLRDEFLADLGDQGTATAILGGVRLMRLQQITGGYIPRDEDQGLVDLVEPKKNPRLSALLEIAEDVSPAPMLVWARFDRDVDLCVDALRGAGLRVTFADGRIDQDERMTRANAFQAGDYDALVMKASAMGEGYTLTRATVAVYYSCGPYLLERTQSEARPHRQGQKNKVTVFDLIADGTVDEKIVKDLRNNRDVASSVMGDPITEWI